MNMNTETVLYLVSPGPRPAYYKIADHLWGAAAEIDSDGNSDTPDDNAWTELTLALRRGGGDQTVNIDPVSESPLVLAVRSPSMALAHQTAAFLADCSGGRVCTMMAEFKGSQV